METVSVVGKTGKTARREGSRRAGLEKESVQNSPLGGFILTSRPQRYKEHSTPFFPELEMKFPRPTLGKCPLSAGGRKLSLDTRSQAEGEICTNMFKNFFSFRVPGRAVTCPCRHLHKPSLGPGHLYGLSVMEIQFFSLSVI